MQTFCPRLWDEIYIDEKGNVFSCCYKKPQIIGNIYKHKLKTICNNKIIQELRKKALNGQLECFHKCTLLTKQDKIQTKNKVKINYNELKRLKIMFGEACNIRCIMCFQKNKHGPVIDYKKFIKHMDITPFERIDIQGGEPLFMESAKKFFDYAAEKGKKVSFLTNGLLIDNKWAKKIALHSNYVFFSLNAATKITHESINKGSKWETVLNNIQKVRKAREKYKTDVRIRGHMTIIPKNLKEIPLFIRKSKEFGFDLINFSFDNPSVPRYLRINPFKKILLKDKIRKAIKQTDIKIKTHRLKLLGLF